MYTPNVETRRAVLALSAVLVCLAACADNSSSADDTVATLAASSSTAAPTTTAVPTTTAAPTSTDAPTTTVEVTTTDAASELLVLEGAWSGQDEIILMPEGFTNSIALEGDLVGQGVFFGTATPEGESLRIEGDWAFHLSSSELGEGLFAVQNWDGLNTPTGFDGTGEVMGVSGGFTDLIGTFSATRGSDNEGTYVIELQPAAPSPEPSEATETVSIEVNDTSVAAWTTCDPVTLMCTAESAFGGGTTMTGDVVGSSGWTGNISSEQTISINVGTLDGTGDGVFITVAPLNGAETYTVPVEFFGVSGAFAGLAGVGTSTVTARDATGALAPTSVSTFELSR